MQIEILIDGVDFTELAIHRETQIDLQSDGSVSTARVALRVDGALGAVYGAALYGISAYGSTATTPDVALKEIIIREADASPANVLFRGEVVRATKQTQALQFDIWRLEAVGFEYKLDQTTITQLYANQTDRAIIQGAFGSALPEILTANSTVDQIQTNLVVDAVNFTLRELWNAVSGLSGARWFLDSEKRLYYGLAGSSSPPAAAFDIDVEYPDGSTTETAQLTLATLDYSKVANHVTVEGGYKSGGTRVSRTAQDATSQSAYGVRKRVIVDAALTTDAIADKRAEAEILQWKDAQQYGSFETRRDGLALGQRMHIEARALGISGDFVIKRLSMRWETKYTTLYNVEYGTFNPRLDTIIRQLEQAARGRKGTLLALPPEDSVDTVHIKSLAVTTAKIANLAVDGAKIADLAVGSAKIANLAVTSGKIANLAVGSAQIQDLAVTEAKIADLAVTSAKIGNLSVAKLTSGTATFSSTATFNQGSAQLQLSAGAVILKAASDQELFITGSLVTLRNSTHKVEVTSSGVTLTGGGNTATLTSSSLTLTAGTANTVISAGGVQIYGGSTGVGIGNASYASSPVRVSSSLVRLEIGSIFMQLTSSEWRANFNTNTVLIDTNRVSLSGIEIQFNGPLKDGSTAAIYATRTVKDGAGVNQTVTISNGLITGWTT